jgi:TonB family protein
MNITSGGSQAWFWLLADCAVKASIVMSAAWLLTRALRRHSAATRHTVWAAAAICALALPAIITLLPAWHPAVLANAASSWVPVPGAGDANVAGAGPGTIISAVSEGASRPQMARIIVELWAAGFITALAFLLLGSGRLLWLAANAEPVFVSRWMHLTAELSNESGLRRPVRLLQNRHASMPVTWGALHPRVMLPRGAENWPPERIRMVLSHELAHVQRFDWLIQILAEVARAVYWFHPLVWLGCNRLRQESEHACDDAVLNRGIEPPEYAEVLLELARNLNSSDAAWPVAVAMARRSNLERRFTAMFNSNRNRRGASRRTAILTAAAALCLLVPLAALRAPGQSLSDRFTGSIYDPSGAVIPNATVIMSNIETGTKDMTTTSAAGVFEFRGLLAGRYDCDVLATGFARYHAPGIDLAASQSLAQNVTMELGRASERVNVIGDSTGKPEQKLQSNTPPKRIRVGGNVAAMEIAKKVAPAYPAGAKAAGVQGAVLLEAVVGKEGIPMSLRVLNSQVDPELARSAVEAVNQWRYRPTLLNGDPVEVITEITVNYTLSQ